MSQKDRIRKALEFSKKAEKDIPKNEVEKIEAVVYAMAEKFLEKVEMNEIREAMKMTRLGQMLREEGREEGREDLAKLVQLLMDNDRMDDLKKITQDSEYCKELLKEFHIE